MEGAKALTLMLSTSVPILFESKWTRHIPLFVDQVQSTSDHLIWSHGSPVHLIENSDFTGRLYRHYPNLQFLPNDLAAAGFLRTWTVAPPANSITWITSIPRRITSIHVHASISRLNMPLNTTLGSLIRSVHE